MNGFCKLYAKLVLCLFLLIPTLYAQAPMQASEEDKNNTCDKAKADTLATEIAQSEVAWPNAWNVLLGFLEAQATNGLLHGGVRLAVRGYADSTFDSIKANLTNPWELDQSRFRTNMLGHPYQGVFYYQAARSNNWHFYASAANAVLGSLVWEIFCEPARGSINDAVITPLGGAVFGEALHRLYYSAENLPAPLRFIISPFDFINRYLPGNPPAKPSDNDDLWQLDAQAGLFFGAQARANLDRSNPSVSFAPGASIALNAVYGNPYTTYVPWSDPFRAFELIIVADASYPIYQIAISAMGMLFAVDYETANTKGIRGLSLHFDTLWGANVSFGGSSLDFTLTSRRAARFGNIDFKLHAGALLFGSASTFYTEWDLSNWNDEEFQVYGSGANLKFSIGINDTPAGDFAFTSALYLMPLYYDKAGYADWGDIVFFWNPSFIYSINIARRIALSVAVSETFCIELFKKRENIIENTAIVRVAAGYRFRSK